MDKVTLGFQIFDTSKQKQAKPYLVATNYKETRPDSSVLHWNTRMSISHSTSGEYLFNIL